MADDRHPSPTDQFKSLYEETEQRTARAFEELVSRDSFGELLARLTENIVGMLRIGNDVFDLMLRNLRLAGRSDITRLGRQLARTEDKLELVLQEVERVQDRLGDLPQGTRAQRGSSNGRGASRGRTTSRGRGGDSST